MGFFDGVKKGFGCGSTGCGMVFGFILFITSLVLAFRVCSGDLP